MSEPLPARAPEQDPPPVAILAAMRAEVAPLLSRLARRERIEIGRCRAHRGRLAGTPVVVAHTGEGRERAAEGVAALLDRLRPRLVIVVGIAGGLSPALRAGDLVVAREVRDERGDLPAPDGAWVERALRLSGGQAGTVLSTERILGSVAAKAAARAHLPGDGPATVDLESAAYARAAAERGLPYVVVRSVSDTAHEGLPLDLERCRDGSGAIRRADVVRRALLHPASARGLWRLRQRLARGARSLARVVQALLDSPAGREPSA